MHPERVDTINRLKELQKDGRIELIKLGDLFKPIRKKIVNPSLGNIQCIELQDIEVDYGLTSPRIINALEAGTSIWSCEGDKFYFQN